MGQAPLVGQQQQPLRVLVQAAHGKQFLLPKLPGQQVQDGFPLPVRPGGEVSGGLIQHNPGIAAVAQRLSPHGNPH